MYVMVSLNHVIIAFMCVCVCVCMRACVCVTDLAVIPALKDVLVFQRPLSQVQCGWPRLKSSRPSTDQVDRLLYRHLVCVSFLRKRVFVLHVSSDEYTVTILLHEFVNNM